MAGTRVYQMVGLLAILFSCAAPYKTKAQMLLEQPYRITVLESRQQDQTQIRLAHNFPGFVQLRLVYAYADGKFAHRISTILQGYHQVWSLRPLPATAGNLQFESLSVQYGAYTLQCDQKQGNCLLQLNGHVLDSTITFQAMPLQKPAKPLVAATGK